MNFKNIAIPLLVLLNIVLLTFIWIGKPKRHGSNDGKLFQHLKKELALTDEQVFKMKDFRDANKNFTRKRKKKIDELKKQFESLIIAPQFDTTLLNSTVNQISTLTFEIDKELVIYLRQSRDILNPEQQKKFDEHYRKFVPRPRNRPKGHRFKDHKPKD